MSLLRINLDLAIPSEVAEKTAVKDGLTELYKLIKQAKALSVKINEGKDKRGMTVHAVYHTCRHDEGGICEAEKEI